MESLPGAENYAIWVSEGPWRIVGRSGYLADKRDEIEAAWDREYGSGNWRIAYAWFDKIVIRAFALEQYKNAYFAFLVRDRAALARLLGYRNVYDTDVSNVESFLDYDFQTTGRNAIHDTAIRWAVAELGLEFDPDGELLHVRGADSPGYWLNPGVVPFHRPEAILPRLSKNLSGKNRWWRDGTIEAFYQHNKVLLARDPTRVRQRT